MKNLKRLGFAAFLMMAGATVMTAQDKVETSVSADVVNQYIWRGTKSVSYTHLTLPTIA